MTFWIQSENFIQFFNCSLDCSLTSISSRKNGFPHPGSLRGIKVTIVIPFSLDVYDGLIHGERIANFWELSNLFIQSSQKMV
jgi:hypothetical protein